MTARIRRVVLLTSTGEAPVLTRLLREQNPQLDVVPVHDPDSLGRACGDRDGLRLIAVCSSVIVPADVLHGLEGPAYNFHPGPPTRPGRYPSVFALYHDDAHFGVTVHEMAAKVDSGPIVAVDWFNMPADCGLALLESTTLLQVIDVFARLAPHLATDRAPLPHIDVAWSGARTTRAQAIALGRITSDLSAEEIARRRRALGGQVMEDPGWMETSS